MVVGWLSLSEVTENDLLIEVWMDPGKKELETREGCGLQKAWELRKSGLMCNRNYVGKRGEERE